VRWWGLSKLHFRFVYNVSGIFMNVYNAPTVAAHYLLAGAHGAVRFNKLCRVIIVIGFALFVFFRFAPVLGSKYGPPQSKYITDAARKGNRYYDEYLGVSVNFTPVNDISVKLPLVVIVIAAWCNFYYFLMGAWHCSGGEQALYNNSLMPSPSLACCLLISSQQVSTTRAPSSSPSSASFTVTCHTSWRFISSSSWRSPAPSPCWSTTATLTSTTALKSSYSRFGRFYGTPSRSSSSVPWWVQTLSMSNLTYCC